MLKWNKLKEDPYDLVIHWGITESCNLSCHYCIAGGGKVKPDHAYENINIPALIKFLKKQKNRVKILFAGGEPMMVDNIVDAVYEVTKKNYAMMITNLTSPKFKEFAERVSPVNVLEILASAHIKELEKRDLMDTFINNYKILSQKGFNISVEEVGHPSMVNEAKNYLDFFKKHGITLKFQHFRGVWKDKNYPLDYSEEERKIFEFDEEYFSKKFSPTKDKLCNAGHNLVVAYSDGTIYPCYNINEPLGNIYDSVKLKKALTKCPYDFCGTPFFIYEPSLLEKAIKNKKV